MAAPPIGQEVGVAWRLYRAFCPLPFSRRLNTENKLNTQAFQLWLLTLYMWALLSLLRSLAKILPYCNIVD